MQVIRREGESFEEFFARYKKSFSRSGILRDQKRGRFFLSRGETRRLKRKAAERRRRRALRSARSRPRSNRSYTPQPRSTAPAAQEPTAPASE